jgi:Domain of unknown function (DUF5615)
MLRLAADENFRFAIVRGLRRRNPSFDIVRVQDAGLMGADDSEVLAWAAQEGRVLVTHDIATISRPAYDRVLAGQAMPGVFKVSRSVPIAQVVEDLLLLMEASEEGEWEGKVLYLPL